MSNNADNRWIVMKFGGTSVSSAECWRTIIQIAKHRLQENKRVLIVVSALSGVTNLLTCLSESPSRTERETLLEQIEQQHRQLMASLDIAPSPRFEQFWTGLCDLVHRPGLAQDRAQQAHLLAHGEWLSSSIGEAIFKAVEQQIGWQDARGLLQAVEPVADSLSARCRFDPDDETSNRLAGEGRLIITQGFIASREDGATCLLGRGGSDTSAACLAAVIDAEVLEIWTDVPGMFSADPRNVPEARVLRQLDYSEAQELASMGARVLHPPSIQPARVHRIPVVIKDTQRPSSPGTRISATRASEDAQVKGVVSRGNITLINMESPSMWHQSGFLADVFAVFKQRDISVDLISTSESSVTVSLDPGSSQASDQRTLEGLVNDLQRFCTVKVHTGCVSISLVGRAIRTILGRLSAALDVFQDRLVHMVTQSANDLNLTLVVDTEHSDSLVRKLHQLLIASQADNRPEFGPSWLELTRDEPGAGKPDPWWQSRSLELISRMNGREALYVYHLDSMVDAALRLLALKSVDRVLYAVKANDHPDVLNALWRAGTGFECVSMAEVDHVLSSVPAASPSDLLFTPNFAARQEYERAFESGVRLTVDNDWALMNWPELFAGRDIFLRLDLDAGYGHHKKVITSGADSKFGISLDRLTELAGRLAENRTSVLGLHAHTGSGVASADVWREQLERFLSVLPVFPDVSVLDLGGGLGVPYRRSQPGFDLDRLDHLLLEAIKGRDMEIWLEPGRYLVAEGGVLLSRVTQLKTKGQHNYLGISTGMNSLIRPALYGAYHDIVNLSRLEESANQHYRVVGPICESGDVLGESRFLPESKEGDIILIAATGAYGRVMASSYNRRAPAREVIV